MASDKKALVPHADEKVVRIGDITVPIACFCDDAKVLLRSLKGKTDLSDDDVLMIALVTTQAVLNRHIQPPDKRSDSEALDDLLAIFDDHRVVDAAFHKMADMVKKRRRALKQAG